MPEHVTVFGASEVESAFRWLQDASHIGKAVVQIPDDRSAIDAAPLELSEVRFDPNASYLITGGLGGLGKSVSRWMAERGARSIVFLSRSAGKSVVDQEFLRELSTMGCRGIAVPGRVDIEDDVKRAIKQAPRAIKGVIHLAMVQREGMALDISHENWQAAVAPKVEGTWHLHNCLASNPLDFFIMTSTVLTLARQPGESNYAAANTFIEAFAQYRRRMGLPASALVVCPLAEVGFVSDNSAAMRKIQSGGYRVLAEKEFLDFVEYAMRHQLPRSDASEAGVDVESDATAPWVDDGYVAMGIDSDLPLSDPNCLIPWRYDARLGSLHNIVSRDGGCQTTSAAPSAAAGLLARAQGDSGVLERPETAALVAVEIGERVRVILMRGDDPVDVRLTPQQAGVDSLMAVELRRWWKVTFGVEVTTLEIMGSGTLNDLGELTLAKMREMLKKD